MQTRSVFVCLACALSLLACEDEPDTSTEVAPIQPGGSASRGGGAFDTTPMVPAGLSCGGLVGASACDPVTGWPCDTSRETCGYSASAGAYRCFQVPNQQPLCGGCDLVTTFCAPGLFCDEDLRCGRLCCVDSDCPIGRCIPDPYSDDDVASIGSCADESQAVCGDAGAQP